MEIEARRDDRGYALIANFIDGFALGWKMAIPEFFREALDIRLTPRMLLGKTEMLWTQGRIYDFHDGDILYDTKLAYTKWGEALKHLRLSIQVQFASSAGYVNYETIKTKEQELEVIQQKGNSTPKEHVVDGLVVKKYRLNRGHVKFKVYRPNKGKTAVEERELIECTQDDFVAFLQTGIVRTKDNKKLNLFTELPNQSLNPTA